MVENMEAKKSSWIKSRPVSRPATITIHLPDGTIVERDAMVCCPSSEDRDRVITETFVDGEWICN